MKTTNILCISHRSYICCWRGQTRVKAFTDFQESRQVFFHFVFLLFYLYLVVVAFSIQYLLVIILLLYLLKCVCVCVLWRTMSKCVCVCECLWVRLFILYSIFGGRPTHTIAEHSKLRQGWVSLYSLSVSLSLCLSLSLSSCLSISICVGKVINARLISLLKFDFWFWFRFRFAQLFDFFLCFCDFCFLPSLLHFLYIEINYAVYAV